MGKRPVGNLWSMHSGDHGSQVRKKAGIACVADDDTA